MKNDSSIGRKVKVGIVLSYVLIGINILSGFLLVPFIIKSIGSSDYGVYTGANSLITMFLIDFGLGTAVTKFVSKYRATSSQEEIDKVIKVISRCFVILAVVFLVVFTIMYLFLDKIYASFTPIELSKFKIVFLMVAIYSVVSFPFSISNGILVAYDMIFLSKIADIISKIVFIVATVFVLLFNLGLYFLTACFLLHGFIGIGLKVFFVFFKTPIKLFTPIAFKEFKKIFLKVFSFSFWASINSFGRIILISVVPSFLGYTSGTNEIAIFSIAYQIESYVALFATAFGSIFYPSISRILFHNGEVSQENKEAFFNFHIKIARFQVVLLLLINAGLIICGKRFILLWVGPEYEKSYICMLLICLPSLVFYPLQTAENAIAAIDKIRSCALGTIISTVIGSIFAIVLSFKFGAIGASIGVCIGEVLRTVFFNLSFKKYLNVNPLAFYYKSYFSFFASTMLSVACGVIAIKFFQSVSWAHFLLVVAIMSVSYLVCVAITGFNKSEKEILNSFLEKMKTRIKTAVEWL